MEWQDEGIVLGVRRHGETSANLEGRWHGHTDTPLSDRGERQAQEVERDHDRGVGMGERP